MDNIITRSEYMSGHFTHNQYYGQFVDDSMIGCVSAVIGKGRIVKSIDPYFNDISMRLWDRAAGCVPMHIQRFIAKCNGTGGISLSDKVCAVKATARHIRKLYSEPACHSVTVLYRNVGDSCGSSSFDTDINGTVDGIVEYYTSDPINIGSGENDRMVKVINVEFHS